jgi:hypothetical protein
MVSKKDPSMDTPHEEKFAGVFWAMHKAGIQPSPKKMQEHMGQAVRHGGDLNGRDSKLYAEMMEAAGYVRVIGKKFGARWRRPDG